MAANFRVIDRAQPMLLPPSVEEWVPEGHLARLVVETVDQLDLSRIVGSYNPDGIGGAAYDPRSIIATLIYAYAHGSTSSRDIETLCLENAIFRFLSCNQMPDHSTSSRFRKRHSATFTELFAQVLDLCRRSGLGKAGTIALDGTKLKGNAALKQELRAKGEYLETTNEKLETSNEELRSSNEEMQSVNEELHSTNEEVEISKKELQSVNEELATVNAELQIKVVDLSRANNDMNNLLAGTGIGTIFVNHQLRILRFTPSTTRVINLILSDVGRPVGHLVSNLVGYDRLVVDAQAVLDTLAPKEVDVQTLAGAWYTMRILPYRTLDNVIEGAVITFVDITEWENRSGLTHRTQYRHN